jgi:hypothetical protein
MREYREFVKIKKRRKKQSKARNLRNILRTHGIIGANYPANDADSQCGSGLCGAKALFGWACEARDYQ